MLSLLVSLGLIGYNILDKFSGLDQGPISLSTNGLRRGDLWKVHMELRTYHGIQTN